MAFDEVTLFEFDLTDAQFGPRDMNVPDSLKGKVDTGSSADADVEARVETEDESSSGGGMGRTLLMAVVALVAVGLVAKRMRGGSDEEQSTPIEFEEDEEAPEIGA